MTTGGKYAIRTIITQAVELLMMETTQELRYLAEREANKSPEQREKNSAKLSKILDDCDEIRIIVNELAF